MKKLLARTTIIAALTAFGGASASAQTDIQWWHSMDGSLGVWVNDLARQFNESQSEYRVVPTYKGSYDESMAAGIAAFRANQAPDILQVYEVGTASMIYARGVTKSVADVMSEAGVAFDPESYIPAISGYYTAPNGQMLSFPFNSSTTVFFYNKDAFANAGLDPEQPPKTWDQVRSAATALKDAGSRCPMTIAWMGWTQLESFSAWHNVLYATHSNGMDGLEARLVFNSPLHVRHFENLGQMARNGEFIYKGRGPVAASSFTAGECAMFIGSSGSYAGIKRDAQFAFGESELPYYDDVPGAPQNTIIGGASLWVMSGKPANNYKGVAEFFKFLSDPQIQAESHMRTGYLPITMEAFKITEESGFYKENPGTDVPVNQMIRKTTDNSRGLRLGSMLQIRAIIDEETEQVWTGQKTAQQALDSAVRRGNELLVRFEAANK